MKKTAVIVGFGPGNGLALAKAFAGEGYSLGLISRSEKNLATLKEAGTSHELFEGDAADASSLTAALAHSREKLGPASLLIYNAFAMRMGPGSKLSAEDLLSDLRANVGGALTAVHSVLPDMRIAQQGTILFTGGGFAIEPMPSFASVGIGKAALRNLALVLARELAPEKIRVGMITINGMVKAGTHFDPEKIAEKFVEFDRDPAGPTEIFYR